MEIFSAEQIRAWDRYTIEHTPIASIDLMERAAEACLAWLEKNGYAGNSFTIFCGKGNNGGDGLALARLLARQDCPVTVYILEFGHKGTEDFQVNLARLHNTSVEIRFIQTEAHLHPIPSEDTVIDALLGSGLNRPLEGVTALLTRHLNQSGNTIISIDLPSGLFASSSSKGLPMVHAAHTLSFQCYKPALLLPENEQAIGEVHILNIGLLPAFLKEVHPEQEMVDARIIGDIYRPRPQFAHKGTFGHALLVAGSYGKIGAALLSASACLRSGAGLLTCHIPQCGYSILQTALPEAMIDADPDALLNTSLPGPTDRYSTIGIGPGIGTDPRTLDLLIRLLQEFRRPMVLDADALNLLAAHPALLEQLPSWSILTPHPGEFQRLFGPSEDDFARIRLAAEKARSLQCVIILKGHYTYIAMPGGKGYFNSTGNPGMAKGGSGDVLTGILTALLSQGYSSGEAALLGVYLHGMAGDLAAVSHGQESMLAGDLTEHLGKAFLQLAAQKAKSILPET